MIQLQHGIPLPTPEHQRRISRQKWFEVATVVVLIIAGVGWLAWRSGSQGSEEGLASLSEAAQSLLGTGLQERGHEHLEALELREFSQSLDPFACTVAVAGGGADAPVDLVLIALYPQPGQPNSAEGRQRAVNVVMNLGRELVPASTEALEKAVRTSEFLAGAPRPHDKGVAATNNGWKVTYITYHDYEDTDPPQPVLYYVLQRLDAASNEATGPLYRSLFQALHNGEDALTRLRDSH